MPHDEDHAALRQAAAHPGAALCTVVGIEGSFSRRLGAQLAILPGGETVGSLADGCLESELARQAELARARGERTVIRYGAGSPVIDFRLPCGSGIDVLVDPAPERQALAAALTALDARMPVSLALPCPIPGLLSTRTFIPALRLVVIGTGPERAALADLARAQGLAAVTAGPDDGLSLGRAPDDLPLDPWSAVVLLFHDHEWEAPLLAWALGSEAFYIGAQGGRAAREARLERLAALGIAAAALTRLRSPVGLIPHARDPRTLGLSILAEVVGIYEDLHPRPDRD